MTKLKSRPADYTAMEGSMADSKNSVSPVGAKTYVGKEIDEENQPCGWGPFHPGICQRFRDPKWVLFWLCWAGAIQGMVVNGFVNVVISNLERRYEISSTESGTIASCYDIASVLCLIPVSYFGGMGLKPRYLGIGMFVMAVGSYIFSLPHFTTGLYIVENNQENVCRPGVNQTSLCDVASSPKSLSQYKYVFFLGQLLHGAGAAPLYTLGVTYLDENLPLRSSSFYVGIFYSFAIIGPAIGYMAGGEFLKIYTDVGAIDTSKLGVTPENPRWVGAWWIGFLVSGALALFVSIPLAGFPRSLPGSSKYKAERGHEVYHSKGTEVSKKVGQQVGLKDILLSIKLLVTNPTFMFLNFAAASEGIILSGFSTFAPKFIEAQFSLSAALAAQYVGFAAIPAGGGGTFLGGYLVKRFNMRVKGIMKLCLVSTLLVVLVALVFLINCPNVPFAGVNVNYNGSLNNSTLEILGMKLDDKCNNNCGCTEDDYHPVCGMDGIMYFSPCYAGCQNLYQNGDKKYTNCSCINYKETADTSYLAVFGKCKSSCSWLPLFMPFFAIMMLLTFLTSMPALSATLRCVPDQQRSFALGIQWIIARCLGSIPGPILFGKMIDITCQLWQKKCDEQGSCFFHDNRKMSYNLLALALVLKAMSSLFFFLALMLYKSPPPSPDEVNLDESTSISGISSASRNTINAQSSGTPMSDTPQLKSATIPNSPKCPQDESGNIPNGEPVKTQS